MESETFPSLISHHHLHKFVNDLIQKLLNLGITQIQSKVFWNFTTALEVVEKSNLDSVNRFDLSPKTITLESLMNNLAWAAIIITFCALYLRDQYQSIKSRSNWREANVYFFANTFFPAYRLWCVESRSLIIVILHSAAPDGRRRLMGPDCGEMIYCILMHFYKLASLDATWLKIHKNYFKHFWGHVNVARKISNTPCAPPAPQIVTMLIIG